MKTIYIVANLGSWIFAIGAIILALNNNSNWVWFVICSLLVTVTSKSTKSEKK